MKYKSISVLDISNAVLHYSGYTYPEDNRGNGMGGYHLLFIYGKDIQFLIPQASTSTVRRKLCLFHPSILFSVAAFRSCGEGLVWALDLFPSSRAVFLSSCLRFGMRQVQKQNIRLSGICEENLVSLI